MPSNTNWLCKLREFAVKRIIKIMYNFIKRRQTCYIYTFFKANQDVRNMFVRAQSNSFRCELDTEHQTGKQFSKQSKSKINA